MFRDTTPTVDALENITIRGNVVPHRWFKTITKENGKPHLVAIIILADILYWYRPAEVRDETSGHVIGVRKKFSGDKLQRKYSAFAELFGVSKKVITEAIHFLNDRDLITMEFRTVTVNDESTGTELTLNNVLYLEPVLDSILSLGGDPPPEKGDTPLPPKRGTQIQRIPSNTDIEKKVPSELKRESGDSRPTRRTSRRKSVESTNPTENTRKGSSESKKGGECSATAWQRYAPLLYNWNLKYKNLANLRFPKLFEESAPAAPQSFPDVTKTVITLVKTLDAIEHGEFFKLYPHIKKQDVKQKFPIVYNKLTLKRNVDMFEVEEALRIYRELFEDGNWPENKSTLAKDWTNFFFNYGSKKSWFLYCLNVVVTGNREFETRETSLSDFAKETVRNNVELFSDPVAAQYEALAHWWAYMKPKVYTASKLNSINEEDRQSGWGHLLEDDEFWIDNYLQWLWGKLGDEPFTVKFFKGGSKWAIGFIRYWMNYQDQKWEITPEEWENTY